MTALLTSLVALLLVAVALLAVLVLGLLRSHALILKSLHDLGAGLELEEAASADPASGGGAPGPVPVDLETGVVPAGRGDAARVQQVRGVDLDGGTFQRDLTQGRHLLAFLSTGCSVCASFWEELRGDVEVPGGARLLVIAKDDDEESPSVLSRLARGGPEVVQSGHAWDSQDIPGSPYFVYVVDGEVVGEGSATSWAQVSDLMAQAVSDHEHRTGAVGRGPRDDPASVDAELRAAGVGPHHHSLYPDPSSILGPAEPAPGASDGQGASDPGAGDAGTGRPPRP